MELEHFKSDDRLKFSYVAKKLNLSIKKLLIVTRYQGIVTICLEDGKRQEWSLSHGANGGGLRRNPFTDEDGAIKAEYYFADPIHLPLSTYAIERIHDKEAHTFTFYTREVDQSAGECFFRVDPETGSQPIETTITTDDLFILACDALSLKKELAENISGPESIRGAAPTLAEWLKGTRYLSAKQGLLLLSGHNPLILGDIVWGPSQNGLYCQVNHIERLNWTNNHFAGFALYSRQQLEDAKKILDSEASKGVTFVTETIKQLEYAKKTLDNEESEGITSVTETIKNEISSTSTPLSGVLPSIHDCRDNEAYRACDQWLRYYNESETLLSLFVSCWLDIPRDIDETKIEVSYFLKWAWGAGLHERVPWWQQAVDVGLIQDALARLEPDDEQPELATVNDAAEGTQQASKPRKRPLQDELLTSSKRIADRFNKTAIALNKIRKPRTWGAIQKLHFREINPHGLPLKYPDNGKKTPSIWASEVDNYVESLPTLSS